MHDDDEGIIDLSALSKPPAALAGPVFTSETPPAAFAVEAPAPSKGSSAGKIIALIAGGLVLLALVGFGLRMLFKTREPIARTAPPPPSVVVAAATAPPPPAPEPAADPPPAASEDPPPPVKKKGRGKFFRPTGGATPPSPKAADPCGCKGNFDCNLRCAAGSK